MRLDHVSRQELRLLALGDVQQRRHQGRSSPTSGAAARGRAAAPPICSTWGANAIFDIVDKKLQFGGYYKMPAAQTETGELRRAQRLAHPGARPRHHGAGLVSGRRVGVRLHRFGEPGRDRVLRSRSDRREEPDHRRLLVGLLVQRQHLRRRDRARHRHLPADAERVPVAERDRRRHAGARRPSSTRSSSRGSPGRRPSSSPGRISISSAAATAIAPERAQGRARRARRRSTSCAPARSAMPPRRLDAARPPSAAQVEARREVEDAAATRCGCTALAETLKGRAAALR